MVAGPAPESLPWPVLHPSTKFCANWLHNWFCGIVLTNTQTNLTNLEWHSVEHIALPRPDSPHIQIHWIHIFIWIHTKLHKLIRL